MWKRRRYQRGISNLSSSFRIITMIVVPMVE